MVSRSSSFSNTGVVQLLPPAARTADANSAGMDTRDCEAAGLLFNVGVNGDALSGAVYIELEVQESDDNATFTAVANTDINNYAAGTSNTGTTKKIAANADANQAYFVGYKGYKRYIRGVVNITGAHTNGTIVGVTGVKGRNHLAPVNANT